MTEAKFRDIIYTMVELDLIDPIRAMYDPEYLVSKVKLYIECANVAREMMNMEPLV